MDFSEEYLDSLSNDVFERLLLYIFKRFGPSYIAGSKTCTDALANLFSHPSSTNLRQVVLRESDPSKSNPLSAEPNLMSDCISSNYTALNSTSNRSSLHNSTPLALDHSSSNYAVPDPTLDHLPSGQSSPNPSSRCLSQAQVTLSKTKGRVITARLENIVRNLPNDSPDLTSFWVPKDIFPVHKRPWKEGDHTARYLYVSNAIKIIEREAGRSVQQIRILSVLSGNEQDFIKKEYQEKNPIANKHDINKHLSTVFGTPIKSLKGQRTQYSRYLSFIRKYSIGSIFMIGDYIRHHTDWNRLAEDEFYILTAYIRICSLIPRPKKDSEKAWETWHTAWTKTWVYRAWSLSCSSINEGSSTITGLICHYVRVDENGEVVFLVTSGAPRTPSADESEPMPSNELLGEILKLYKDINNCTPPCLLSDDDEPLTDNECGAREAEYSRNSEASATHAAHILADMSGGQHNGDPDGSGLPSQHIEESSSLELSIADSDESVSDIESLTSNSEEENVNNLGKRPPHGIVNEPSPKRQRAFGQQSFRDEISANSNPNPIFNLNASADNTLAHTRINMQTQSRMAQDNPNGTNQSYNPSPRCDERPPGVFPSLNGTEFTRPYAFNMESPSQNTQKTPTENFSCQPGGLSAGCSADGRLINVSCQISELPTAQREAFEHRSTNDRSNIPQDVGAFGNWDQDYQLQDMLGNWDQDYQVQEILGSWDQNYLYE